MSPFGATGSRPRSAPRGPRHTSLAVGVLAAVALAAAGCANLGQPRAGAAASEVRPARPPEVPVVLVPGMTGSKLRDRATGEVVWGRGIHLLLPRDGGYGSALPIAGEPRLEAFAVLEELRLGPLRKGIYGPLLEYLERHGYRRGGILGPAAPRGGGPGPAEPEATLFTFPYDWRGSSVDAAGELARALEALRRRRGEERLAVDLVCQSSGGYVCRWLAKHGGASLEEAEARVAGGGAAGSEAPGPLPRVTVRKVVLVGSANGGSLRSFKELHRGRRYLSAIGRRGLPEALFTFRSLFEDLPHDGVGLLLDADGRTLEEVDLHDPAAWERFGWSVFAPEVAGRLGALDREGPFGSPEERRGYLERWLERAERFQRLLAEDPEQPPAGNGTEGVATRYYLVGNGYARTPVRAVLIRAGGGWRTLFPGDPELRARPYLSTLATAPGDGHASVESMLRLSPRERAAVAAEPFFVVGGHFEMILEPVTHRRILGFLGCGATSEPGCGARGRVPLEDADVSRSSPPPPR